MITKKRHLEMVLQNIPPHPQPDPNLEQYLTPSKIASDLIWNAAALGDIEGLKVVDLGCGTGMLALGAALRGAEEVAGVDVDVVAIKVAEAESIRLEVQDRIQFFQMDVEDFTAKADTVIMNPPFGAQKANRKEADRKFLKKALEISPVVYSFHLKKTEEFLEMLVKALNASITHRFYYMFPLPRMYYFHQEEVREVEVVVLRVERNDE
ncbi:MAG TPA: METTL5 family protein [Methanobacteriaceae archaeon]|nr:METTL5 family protein [Methanobacteriaceae archaeon]